jgi:hypothetical protein
MDVPVDVMHDFISAKRSTDHLLRDVTVLVSPEMLAIGTPVPATALLVSSCGR